MPPNEADVEAAKVQPGDEEAAETAPLASSEDLKVKLGGGGASHDASPATPLAGQEPLPAAAVVAADGSGDAYRTLTKKELMRYASDPVWRGVRWGLFILFWLAWAAMLVASVVIIVMAPKCPTPAPKQWWQKGPVYEVYAKSFKDSDGDGVGDLKGLESKLDYLVDLGVGSVRLSPVYKSPMKDNGYDVADYVSIDPTFGTLHDFQELVAAMHERGLKLIMDFVPNHSSDQHEWFLKSVRREDPFTDYYVWRDGVPGTPPTNWKSVFGGSAWEYSQERGAYYLHQFYSSQPDLNLRNPLVQEELKKVLKFWLDQGVDGFRVDSVAHFYEDPDFRDEGVVGSSGDAYDSVDHKYTYDLPENLNLLKYFRAVLDEKVKEDPDNPRVMMTEAYLPVEDLGKYYGEVEEQIGSISQMPINFNFISTFRSSEDLTAQNVAKFIKTYLKSLPFDDETKEAKRVHAEEQAKLSEASNGKAKSWPLGQAWSNFNLGNHDNSRVASRYGHNLVDAVHMVFMLLQGTPITYYGDEIGMVDTETTSTGLRDQYRTPMQWDGTLANAGFSEGTPWLPVNSNSETVNVAYQQEMANGHLKVYQQLSKLRHTESILYGTTTFMTNGTFFGYARVKKGNPGYLVVVNFGQEPIVQDVTGMNLVPERASIEVKGATSEHDDNVISLKELHLKANEAVVLAFVPNFDKETTLEEELEEAAEHGLV